jgi:hypothetical protein
MNVVIHRAIPAPDSVAGGRAPEYDVELYYRWFEIDGLRYWIIPEHWSPSQQNWVVRDENGEYYGDFDTVRSIRKWADAPIRSDASS